MRFVACDPTAFEPWVQESVDVYGEAMRRPPEVVAQRRSVLPTHLSRPAFRAAVAVDDDSADEVLAGFGYAYAGEAGQWWHDIVTRELSDEDADFWMSDTVEIVELHVRPAYQGNGIGRRLLGMLLDGAPERTAVLSTHDRESPARRLYRSTGFVDLLTAFVFPGGHEVFAVMGKDLRAET